MLNNREIFDQVVALQRAIPNTRENNRAASIADALRRQLGVIEEPFIYNATVTTLAANATDQDTIQIQADADFKILAGTYFADDGNGPYSFNTFPVPDVSILLTDSGSGRNFMDEAVPIGSMFGLGTLPYIWPIPKILGARASLQVQFTNLGLSSTTWQQITLSFIGVKLYPLG